ncbi:MAG TPA: hypothetical protein VN448_08275, partial [Gammaproteobacteria bacterium]|nr:hypothetical protein [Gammaproteobacteria bacterium]
LQTLEAEVAPTGRLPELQRPADQYEAGTQEGERRFDAGLRKATFMRAKLLSLFNAPRAWPPQTLATAVHQMTLLQQTLSAAIDHRWQQYELDYYNEPINPWSVFALDAAKTPQVHNTMLAELAELEKLTPRGSDALCAVHEQWFKHGGAALQTAYALQQLQANQSPRCASPDWAWLKQGETAQALDLRTAYLALPGHIDSGALHDSLLSGLTGNGEACFNAEATPTTVWLQAVCAAWISEPQAVKMQLAHSPLTLSVAEQFQSAPLTSIPESVSSQGDGTAQATWLGGLVANAKDAVGQKMQTLAAEFNRRGATIYAAKKWSHPDRDTALIELQLNLTEQTPETAWPFASSRLLLVIGSDNIALAGIPQRFGYQYDEGEIAHVSDLDEDGQLEVWLSGTFGECDGEELQPGVDCAIEVLHMGEIRGDALSYFIYTPRLWGALSMLNILAAIVGLAVIAAVLRVIAARAKRC